MPEAVRSQLARSTTLNVVAQVFSLVGNLGVTPLFVRALGPSDYGIWAVILAVSGTASAFDLGMSVALTRAVPEYAERRRYDAIASLALITLAFYVVLAGLAIIAAAFIAPAIAGPERPELRAIGLMAAAIFASSSLAAVPKALLQGFDRFDVTAGLTVGGYFLFWVSAITLLGEGKGISALGGSMIAMFLAQAGIGALLLLLLRPEIRRALRRPSIDVGLWRYLLEFGGLLQVSSVADIVKSNGPRLLAAALFGPAAAGTYDIGARIANAAWSVPAALLPAIVPAASIAHARSDQEELRRLYLRSTRLMILIALPLGLLLATTAGVIVPLLVGRGYEQAIFVVVCLSIGNVLHLSTGAGTFVARGVGKPQVEVQYQILTLCLYVTLGFILSSVIQFDGIPLAVSTASIVGGLVFGRLFTRWLGVDPRRLGRALTAPVSAAVVATLCVVALQVLVGAEPAAGQLLSLTLSYAATYTVTLAILYKRNRATVD